MKELSDFELDKLVAELSNALCDKPDVSFDEMLIAIEANKKEIAMLIKAFKHFHENNGIDDSCRECGLDLRNPVHLSSTNNKENGE